MRIVNQFFGILLLSLLISGCGTTRTLPLQSSRQLPKREFRGAWIHTVGQSRYQQMNSAALKHYISVMVKELDEAGINVVIFQIRPEADAFYRSELEPWSRFLTGEQGRAPDDPDFDPLSYIIDQCHSRGMELHAWLNPYRAKANINSELESGHICLREPERFIEYGNQLFFDPGLPENRKFICEVVADIVSRYQVDAIHMDDYFYPYPISGKAFPDDKSFDLYAASDGFSSSERGDWRRHNVNLLIQQIKLTIAGIKPWVRFGISPFGIYRNIGSDSGGSETNGLQNYDDLYADVKLWVEKGWIDYNIPQLYWETDHPAADYNRLLHWWNANNFGQHLYIGQHLKRSIDKNELCSKIERTREMVYVHGNCYWYGYQIIENFNGVGDSLKNHINRAKALTPAYSHMHERRPKRVGKILNNYSERMHFLSWEHNRDRENPETAQKFVVYRFKDGEKINTACAENIVMVTPDNFFLLPYEGGGIRYRYVVTALDAFGNESKNRGIKVKQ